VWQLRWSASTSTVKNAMRAHYRITPAVLVAAMAVLAACDGAGLLAPCDLQHTSAAAECPQGNASAASLTHTEKVDHFLELAIGAGGRIIRWAEPISVEVHGGSTADRLAAEDAAERLSGASGHPIRVVASGGAVTIRIVPRAEFGSYIPGTSSAVAGMCSPRYGADRVINGVTIVVAAELPAPDRARVILHELAHGLGLAGHSTRYPQSVLYPTITRRSTVLEQDRFALQALYRADIRPGMTPAQARSVLDGSGAM
jgi:hypothetical protein